MAPYSYHLAKTTLTEADKDRILCLYLHSTNATIDWSQATADFGSASVESFKKTTANMLKRLDAAARKAEEEGGGDGGGGVAMTPASSGKGKGKKRKAKSEVAEDGDGDGDVAVTPKVKRARAKKGSAVEGNGEGGEKVKEESLGGDDDLV